MNFQNNGKKEKSSQMKTIYITLALSLALMAVLIVLSGAWRRGEETSNVTTDVDVNLTEPDKQVIAPQTENDPVTEAETDAIVSTHAETVSMTAEPEETSYAEDAMAEEVLPEFVAPAAGYLMKGHSGDTPVFSITMNDYRPHAGVDIYASIGDDVFAAAAGTVKDIWEDPLSGNCISIEHNGGAVSIYRNLDPSVPESISVGVQVAAGEVIGTVGDSSLLEIADEAHLHFELTVDGVNVDPAEYISFSAADTEYEG